MSPPTPPASVIPFMQQAAAGTGLPLSVVEAQNFAESGYGSNQGPSSTGALGPWQFEPSTFTGLGFPAGQETNWSVSTQAYIKYMNQLLKQEGGNIFKALEAYNAGPGNLGAGAGYARGIEASAGVSQSATAGSGVQTTAANIGIPTPFGSIPIPGTGSISNLLDPATWIGDLGKAILGAFGVNSAKDMLQRLGLILFGAVLVIVGIRILSNGSSSKSSNSSSAAAQPNSKSESKSPAKEETGLARGGESAEVGNLGATEALEAAAVA